MEPIEWTRRRHKRIFMCENLNGMQQCNELCILSQPKPNRNTRVMMSVSKRVVNKKKCRKRDEKVYAEPN
jgi:hypothetical protein